MEWILEPEDVRVLGVLVEKELSTPQYYPMTLNALRTGCNQKSNRSPVVDYGEGTIMEALDRLMRHRLVGRVTGAGSRAQKYRHALGEALSLTPQALAVLASLMLRGPQTAGALRAHTGRMYPFDHLDEVEAVLAEMMAREAPLVVRLAVLPGQKEARFAHLLSGMPDLEALAAEQPAAAGSRVEQLEAEVARLRDELDDLRTAFEAFRAQFE